jgi:hypothetical protein
VKMCVVDVGRGTVPGTNQAVISIPSLLSVGGPQGACSGSLRPPRAEPHGALSRACRPARDLARLVRGCSRCHGLARLWATRVGRCFRAVDMLPFAVPSPAARA